jgi:hypothetical protein
VIIHVTEMDGRDVRDTGESGGGTEAAAFSSFSAAAGPLVCCSARLGHPLSTAVRTLPCFEVDDRAVSFTEVETGSRWTTVFGRSSGLMLIL